MKWFTSVRERRLWVSVAIVVILIYSTLGFARVLAAELRGRDLISTAFWLALWLVLGAIAILGLKKRPGWLAVGAFLGIAGVYIMVMARMGSPEERTHLVEYGIVAILIYEALKERIAGGKAVAKPALVATAATALTGTIDEVIQMFHPQRVFDVRDIGFNIGAGVMAVTASLLLTWTRNKVSAIEPPLP